MIVAMLMVLAQLPFSGGTLGSAADSVSSVIPIGQVLGWVINLVIAEVVIRRRRAYAARIGPRFAAPLTNQRTAGRA